MKWHPAQLRLWRIAIAAVVAFDLVRMALEITELAVLPPTDDLVYALARSTWLVWLTTLLGLAGLAHHARAPGRLAGATLALAATTLLFILDNYVRGEPNESLAHASVTLWGFVAGTAIARLAGLPPAAREQLAATGAATLLGTAYLAAGAIKLVNSGLAWIEPIRIQMLAVQFLDLPHPTWLTPLRTLLATSPNLAGTIAVATVALELAGGLYVVGPRIRAVLGTGLFAMHAGIWAVTGILFPSVMALLLALSYPWHRLARRAAPPSPDTPEPTPARRAWLGPAACALTAAVALALPSKTFNQPPTHPYYVAFLQQLHRVDRPAYDRLASGEGRLVDTLGPLRTAQPLADGWSISRLRTLPSAASITLARGDDRAELQLVPIPPEGAPPHARTFGPLLLRYQPGPVPSDAFQAAMDALWAELSAAAQGDPAARVLEWLP